MKHLKRITAVLLAVLLTASPLATVPFASVFAAEPMTVITALQAGETVARGEEATFTVSLSAPFTGKSFALDFQSAYDHDVFQWVGGAGATRLSYPL